MGNTVHIELCPETGICSIVRSEGTKLDLLPDEVEAIRETGGDPARVREVLADSDSRFAADLNPDELAQIGRRLA
ncbi:MAG: hypothetical protein ACYDCO_17655 [Armatimonadota bacterium]